jgi:hypothetical protein
VEERHKCNVTDAFNCLHTQLELIQDGGSIVNFASAVEKIPGKVVVDTAQANTALLG